MIYTPDLPVWLKTAEGEYLEAVAFEVDEASLGPAQLDRAHARPKPAEMRAVGFIRQGGDFVPMALRIQNPDHGVYVFAVDDKPVKRMILEEGQAYHAPAPRPAAVDRFDIGGLP